jgi:hypothetical protein
LPPSYERPRALNVIVLARPLRGIDGRLGHPAATWHRAVVRAPADGYTLLIKFAGIKLEYSRVDFAL